MRKLKASEIECRVAQVNSKGCSLLLYKDARVDRKLLTEEYGELWQNDFKVINGVMYGGVGIYNKDLKEWLWRWDAGTPSNTEAEKGQASDCFKRGCFKWGIGVELYSAPFIWLNVETQKNEKGKYELKNKFAKYEVSKIGYKDDEISELEIVDDKGKVVYTLGKSSKKATKTTEEVIKENPVETKEENAEEVNGFDAINIKEDLEEARDLKQLLSVFNSNSAVINSDADLKKLFKDRRAELMKK